MYDAIMLEYAKLKPANAMYNAILNAGALGRADKSEFYGRVITDIKKIQTDYRAKALDIVVRRDAALMDKKFQRQKDRREYKLLN